MQDAGSMHVLQQAAGRNAPEVKPGALGDKTALPAQA